MITALAFVALFATPAAPTAPMVPHGWTASSAAGVTTLVPKNVAPGDLALLAIYPPEAAKSAKAWSGSAWKAFGAQFEDPQSESAQSAKTNSGLEVATSSASFSDKAGGGLYAILYAVGDGTRVQPMLFVAGSIDSFKKYAPAATDVVNATRALSGSTAKTTFASREFTLHGLQTGTASSAPADAAPAATAVAAAPTRTPRAPRDASTPVPSSSNEPDDFLWTPDTPGALTYIATHRVIAEGVNVSLAGEWHEENLNIVLRLRDDGTYDLSHSGAVMFSNRVTGAFSHADAVSNAESGTWTFSDGKLHLTPRAYGIHAVSGYSDLGSSKEKVPAPRDWSVGGVTIEYNPHGGGTKTRPGLHIVGPIPDWDYPSGTWDLVLRSAPWSG